MGSLGSSQDFRPFDAVAFYQAMFRAANAEVQQRAWARGRAQVRRAPPRAEQRGHRAGRGRFLLPTPWRRTSISDSAWSSRVGTSRKAAGAVPGQAWPARDPRGHHRPKQKPHRQIVAKQPIGDGVVDQVEEQGQVTSLKATNELVQMDRGGEHLADDEAQNISLIGLQRAHPLEQQPHPFQDGAFRTSRFSISSSRPTEISSTTARKRSSLVGK